METFLAICGAALCLLWLLLIVANVTRPKTPPADKLELEVQPDAVLVLSSPHPLTEKARVRISAELSAMLKQERRPLVVLVPPGFKIEADLRFPKNSAGESGTTEGCKP